MSHPYPGGPGPYGPVPVLPPPKYRPLRGTAIVSIALMGLTCVAAVIQCIVLWSSYEDVKRFVYGLLSEDEINRGIESVAGSGPLLNLVSYLFFGTGVAFVIWLWQARENTELPRPPLSAYGGQYPSAQRPAGPHRHAQGWVVGAWVCPVVQFWYPLQIVQDVARASEPDAGQPAGQPLKKQMYGWWATWTAFWVIIVGGGGVAAVSFFVWVVRLVDAADTADANGDYVDIYDLQDFMVRVALAVNIGFTVATVLLIAAAVLLALVVLRVTAWQDTRGRAAVPPGGPGGMPGQGWGQPYPGQPPYGVGPSQPVGGPYGPPPGGTPSADPWRSFPSYGGQGQQPPTGPPPWDRR